MTARLQNRPALAFLALVAVFVVLGTECIRANPVLVDEYAHIPSGISYWELGRHYLYRENPPLVRLLFALPVMLSGAKTDYSRADASFRSEWRVGIDFIAANRGRYQEFLGQARNVILLLAVTCGLLIFKWSRDVYGGAAAVVAASIWLLDPSVLAHSTIATVDIGATFFGLAANYLFWRFLLKPSCLQVVIAGVALGLANSAKFTMLVLYPTWAVIMLCARWQPSDITAEAARPTAATWLKLISIYLISLLTLNAVYGFDRVGEPLRSFNLKSHLLSGLRTDDLDQAPSGNRLRGTLLAGFPSPVPEDYVQGFDSQKWEEEVGFFRLAHGQLIHRGNWYSPLATMAYKFPLGTIIMIGAAICYGIARSRRSPGLALWVALITAAALIGTLSSQSGLNWAIRYLVPALPFVALATGPLAKVAWNHRVWKWGLIACIAWNGIAVWRTRPHFISYANEFVGGPERAQQELGGSNFDWGQDLYRLAEWRSAHLNHSPLIVLYFGALSPDWFSLSDMGMPDQILDLGDGSSWSTEAGSERPFYLAISATLLQGIPADIAFASGRKLPVFIKSPRLKPANAIACVGTTIFVFHVVPDSWKTRTLKAITYGELRSAFKEATSYERRLYTLL